MPGSIKIDDGSGNYTILTNAGSLGSDKTITIPNTTGTMALTSDITSGLSAAQQFMLTSNISTTGTNVITSNIAVPSEANMGNLGSLVSESSGIFSFSETGYYLVQLITTSNYNSDGSYAQIYLEATTDNTNYSRLAYTHLRGKNNLINQGFVQVILDITDTSNHKVRFSTDITSGGIVLGATSDANTTFTFFKLGDT